MSTNHNSEPIEILSLFDKRAAVIKPGLERIRAALEILGNPGKNTPRIVIGGTNGKGSTSGMLWRLFSAGGARAGLFSSPHLMEFRERITVTDCDVSNQTIVRHIDALKHRLPVPLWNDLTFFEINTILGFLIFDECKTDVNVLEVGLGGRLDCVNIYDGDVTVITSIGKDHEEFLGSEISTIAREKAGIMRPGVPVIWGGRLSSEPCGHDAILKAAADIGAKLFLPESCPEFTWPRSILSRPDFLRRNFKLAVMAMREFLNLGKNPRFAELRLQEVINRYDDPALPMPVTLRGRFEWLKVSKGAVSRTVLVDVCHNPHGAKALASGLDEMGITGSDQKRCCLISVLKDKDAAGIWAEIKGKINEAIRFQIPSLRTWSSEDTSIDGVMMESFSGAWSEAVGREGWTGSQPWLVFGSVAAVGEVFLFWQKDGWLVQPANIS
jgi:dihydrofolate synthase / folylpolyglutamate synthase